MAIFIYDTSGTVIEQRNESDLAAVGKEVHLHNRGTGNTLRRFVKAESFPPPGTRFDSVKKRLQPVGIRDLIDSGKIELTDDYQLQTGPAGDQIVGTHQKLDSNGHIVSKTIQEQITEGLLTLDSATQKIENEQIVPKTRAEQLSEGNLSLSDIREQEIQRLRAEIEQHFSTAKTANGYRLDTLARQKAAVSLQYRQTDDSDPQKAALLASKVIYPNAMTDEILAKVETVQTAYDQAKAAIELCFTQSKPVADFEAVKIATYL